MKDQMRASVPLWRVKFKGPSPNGGHIQEIIERLSARQAGAAHPAA